MDNNNSTACKYREVDGVIWLKKTTSDKSISTKKMNAEPTMDQLTNNNQDDLDDSEHSYSDKEIILNDEDVWDDSILINMYEDSQKLINEALKNKFNKNSKTNADEKINKHIKNQKSSFNKKASTKPKVENVNNNVVHNWNVDDYCRLIFLEDEVEYEAKIISINHSDDTCLVRYIGYGNEEWRHLDDLKPTAGDYVREMQIKLAKLDGYDQSNICPDDSKFQNIPTINADMKRNFIGRTIPPPPPFIGNETNNNQIVDEEDALASMLMSWYMTGYHTGYYQAQKNKSDRCAKCWQQER